MSFPESYDGEQVCRLQLAASSKTGFGESLLAFESTPRWQRVFSLHLASLTPVQLDFALDLVEGVLAARINVDVDQLSLVNLEARPDLRHHLRIELEILVVQGMVAKLVTLQPPVKFLRIEDAYAPGAGYVLAGRRRGQVRRDILLEVEELDGEGLHGVDRLHTGPLTGDLGLA